MTICGAVRVASVFAFCGQVSAQYATFDQATDTISISGQTTLGTQCTYEAVVRISALSSGTFWNEWQDSAEDKQFGVYSGGSVYGYAIISNPQTIFGGTVEVGQWTHVAYVYDGSLERIYVGGVLVASRSASAPVSNGASSIMAIGAIGRQALYPSFIGDIDSLRISSIARYAGNSFTPTIGNLSSDSSTALLFNFDNAPGTTAIIDESGNGFVGTLGTGFFQATSPTFVPTSGSLPILCFFGAIASRRRRGSL